MIIQLEPLNMDQDSINEIKRIQEFIVKEKCAISKINKIVEQENKMIEEDEINQLWNYFFA